LDISAEGVKWVEPFDATAAVRYGA